MHHENLIINGKLQEICKKESKKRMSYYYTSQKTVMYIHLSLKLTHGFMFMIYLYN